MSEQTCDWSPGKACLRLAASDTCLSEDGKTCAQSGDLEAIRKRVELKYRARFGAALLGAAIICIVVFARVIAAEPSWDSFWSNPNLWIPNAVAWPCVCALLAFAVPVIEYGDLKTFFFAGLTWPTFIYTGVGFTVALAIAAANAGG